MTATEVNKTEAAAAPAPAPKTPATGTKTTATKAAAETKPEPKVDPTPRLGVEPEPRLGVELEDESESTDAPETDPEAERDDKPEDQKPIEYDFTPAEGQEPYREELLAPYRDVLQKHRVDPAAAREVLDTMLPAIARDVQAQVDRQIETRKQESIAELKKRHGQGLNKVMQAANRVLKRAPTAFQTFVSDSVLAVDPDFVDLLAGFDRLLANDRGMTSHGVASTDEGTAVARAARQYDRESANGRAGG